MTGNRRRAQTKRELIIGTWEDLDCESVGEQELERIQQAIHGRFGPGAVESPAAIARLLADEGAVLRHPEVLDCDTKWREREQFGSFGPAEVNFSNLVEAAESIKRFEALRRKLEQDGDRAGLQRMREMALKYKQAAQLVSRSKIIEQKIRFEATEIEQWLTIWLQDPGIFEDWLGLRQGSPEFIQRFQQ